MSNLLKFVPFASSIDPSFWSEFSKRKIDVLKLSEEPIIVKVFSLLFIFLVRLLIGMELLLSL